MRPTMYYDGLSGMVAVRPIHLIDSADGPVLTVKSTSRTSTFYPAGKSFSISTSSLVYRTRSTKYHRYVRTVPIEDIRTALA